MSLGSAASASFRLSLWADSSSYPPPDYNDIHSPSPASSIRSSRPSSSSSRGSIRGSPSRTSRTFSRLSRQRRESITPDLTKRMSFIDFGESSSGLFGALKGKMQRKRSTPLLNSSSSATTSREVKILHFLHLHSSSPFRSTVKQSFFRTSQDDDDVGLTVDTNPSLSFKDERKGTLVPEEIINGIGYGVRTRPRLSTVAESEPIEDANSFESGFRALPLRRRGCIISHSHPRNEAPYMRSYNKVDLHTDAYFHLLLRRLNTSCSPSFHDYLSPPDDVLDLGCGRGTWVQEAAISWPNARIVGYDLVDLVNENAKSTSNATFKWGNFVSYRLPFDSGSFDLVRIANLTEAIPQDRWVYVLVEVRRILKPAGRVEIIDDEVLFPYTSQTSVSDPKSLSSGGPRPVRNSWGSQKLHLSNEVPMERPNTCDSSFLDFGSTAHRESVGSAPSLCRDDSPSDESSDLVHTPTDAFHDFAALLEASKSNNTDDTLEPSTSSSLSQEVECVYTRMLEDIYRINPRPGNFLESLLRRVFGPAGKATVMKDFHLSLLSPEMNDLVVSTKRANSLRKRSNKLLRSNRDPGRIDKNKEIMDSVIISQSKSSKALKLLGADNSTSSSNPTSTNTSEDSDIFDEQSIDHVAMRNRTSSGISTLAMPTSSHPSTASSAVSLSRSRHRPPGLFIFPDQFLELTPSELERHLCKHVDMLLSCKTALDEYVLSLRNENNKAIVQEEDWCDILWEYERSRRERFNLPNPGGQFDDGDDEEEDISAALSKEYVRRPYTLVQPVAMAINNQGYSTNTHSGSESTTHSSTFVRRIRVFEAYKIKPSLPS